MSNPTPLAALLAAVDALRGHDSACEQRRDPFAPCYCGIARVVEAAAAVRAQLAEPMSVEELVTAYASGISSGGAVSFVDPRGILAVASAVRERMVGGA